MFRVKVTEPGQELKTGGPELTTRGVGGGGGGRGGGATGAAGG